MQCNDRDFVWERLFDIETPQDEIDDLGKNLVQEATKCVDKFEIQKQKIQDDIIGAMGQNLLSYPRYFWNPIEDVAELIDFTQLQEKPLRDFDYSRYVKQPFHTEWELERRLRFLRKMKEKQETLVSFKYHNILERQGIYSYAECTMEHDLSLAVHRGFWLGIVYLRQVHFHTTFELRGGTLGRIESLKFGFAFMVFWVCTHFFNSKFSVMHQAYFHRLRQEESYYVQQAEHFNAYIDVQEFKYQTKIPSRREYVEAKDRHFKNMVENKCITSKRNAEYFLADYIDPFTQFFEERLLQRQRDTQNLIKSRLNITN